MSRTDKHKARWAALSLWVALALYSSVLFFLSHQSSVPRPPGKFPLRDKVLHAGAYLLWGAVFALATRITWPRLGKGALVVVTAVAGAVYGLSDEWHQSFIPNRTMDPWDLLADTVGATAGAWLVALQRKRRSSGETRV